MSTDPARHAAAREPESDATAVFHQPVPGSAEGSYQARYVEDSFDYPSPAAEQSWSAGTLPPDAPQAASPGTESGTMDEGQLQADGAGTRPADRWRQVAVRRRPTLLVAAALVALGGFGGALSMVGDTLSSSPVPGAPGDTAPVSAPKSPTDTPSLPPEATASASSPEPGGDGASAAPTGAGLLPGTGEHRDDERGEDHREDHEREDGDGADDG
ncbi:hypothetical protein [Streptomyces scabiei]|uniref:hypothetical protein n=1 Tax=Streptomyces scabiei TaxID=1930 RepID=UPI0029A6183B|nr:hypothetical protein [Streptomyces scabiei]MDX3523272.1 hypothetical protein [Streptomyces scabiei]